jgi:DNA (cytosine-5)-methyltransferase 1
MSRPRLLDLFCGAGGAAVGYHRAGFDVIGVDNQPMPRYPFEFHQADALEYAAYHGHEFDAVHASPPCQRKSAMTNCRPGLAAAYPNLIRPTRIILDHIGVPYVIENVAGSDVRPDLTLCGRMFGLKLYRHRLFESNRPLGQPQHPRHLVPGGSAGHWKPGEIISVSGNCAPIELAHEAMGIDWMTRGELAESIPPAFAQFVGEQLVANAVGCLA